MRRVFIVLLWCLSATSLLAQDAQTPTISVTGEGQAAAVPDMATVTLGVTSQDKSAVEAMRMTSDSIALILSRLEGLGLQPRDVQTSDLSLNPLWSRESSSSGPTKITGYESSNRLTLRVRDLSKLGNVLEESLSDGANRLGGLSFGLRDPQPILDMARRNAVADAVRRAELYAQAAGLTLGRVLSLNEAGGSGPRPEMMMMEMARDSSVPTAAGETGVTARVNMVFALEP